MNKEKKMPETLPPLPWTTRLLIYASLVATKLLQRRDGSVNRCLGSILDLPVRPKAAPVAGVSSSDHTLDPAGGLWVRLFSPSDASPTPLPVIVYFHGGGFAFYSAGSLPFDALCRRISRAIPAAVVSVNYRRAPEHRCPAAYGDGFDALRWVVDGAGGLLPGGHPVFLAGDSAGGNIAHHVARRAAAEGVVVAGAVLLQPFFGGEARTESELRYGRGPPLPLELTDWMWRSFLPEGADRNHEAANPFGPRSGSGSGFGGGYAGFPDTAVFVGGKDPLQDGEVGYVEGLRAAGVQVRLLEYPQGFHGFYAFAEGLGDLPEAKQVITDLTDFVRGQLKKEH